MSDVATADRAKRLPGGSSSDGTRTVRRQTSLPGGRAVVGGFLVALSALGIFSAYSRAAAGPTTSFVVATRDVAIGSRLTPDDLAVVAMELPDALANGSAFRTEATLVGATTIGPVRKGDLVQASDVVTKRSGPEELEVSFALESSRAVAGSLRPGELVDVLATFGAGGDAYTVTVVRHARVLDARPAGGPLAGGDTDVIRLALTSDADALAVTHAVNVGDVTLVRATGTETGGTPGQTYRAPAADEGGTTPRSAGQP